MGFVPYRCKKTMPESMGRGPVFFEPRVLMCCVCVKTEVGLKELLCCRSRMLERNTHPGTLSGMYSVAVTRAALQEILEDLDLGPCSGRLTPQWIMDQIRLVLSSLSLSLPSLNASTWLVGWCHPNPGLSPSVCTLWTTFSDRPRSRLEPPRWF